MTSGPPATEDVFGQLVAMRVIPFLMLDDSAAAAPLAGAFAMDRPGDTATARREEVGNLVAGAGARPDR